MSAIMGDFGKGLRNFKTGLKGADGEEAEDVVTESIAASAPPTKKAARKKSPATKKAAAKKTATKKKVASKKASAKR